MSDSRICRRYGWLFAALFGVSATVFAQLPAPGGKPPPADDILNDLEGTKTATDLEGLRQSHLTLVETWKQVERPGTPSKEPAQENRWKAAGGYATPTSAQPISTLVEVPKDGEYRLYLRHRLGQQQTTPVTVSFEPLKVADAAKPEYVSAGPAVAHRFGDIKLIANTLGKEQEKKLPVRFESDVQLNSFADEAMFVWEYRDVKLTKGPHRITLQSDRRDARVSAVFLTRSKTFRPSFSAVKKDNTLEGVYLRYRVVKGATAPEFTASTGITYHWPGRRAGNSTEPLWYDGAPAIAKVPAKEWSPFVDVREQVIPGGGPWSTWRPALGGVGNGAIEVQFAWAPHEAAVAHTLPMAVSGGRAMFRVPHGRYTFRGPVASAAWGVWDPTALEGFVAEDALVERYFAWAEEATRTLGLKADHPKPKHLKVLTGCQTGAAHQARAAEMMAKLGVNWIPSAPTDVARKYDLYDDSANPKIKMGDEIGTHTPASVINGDVVLLAGFHEYLREQAKLNGLDLQAFLGLDDVRVARSIDHLPENAGRFERRLFYCSQRYAHLATIPNYMRGLRSIEKGKPKALVYNNYSPHPLFLTGRDMNDSDWFLLPRAGAQTLGWAEDWATGGSWGLGTPMTECTTFYAALVDCSVRTRGYTAGFYVGSNCGYSAQKMFSCVSQGITILHLYDWGPIDSWAEGSNSWSESKDQYLSVAQGTHALGPADEIIGTGKREVRRAAVLYNRSHEIVSGSQVTLNRDWMWTFLGLRNSGIPVDVVIEEDLTEPELNRYDVLFIGGLNLERRHLKSVRAWVERGGVLIGSAGTALSDVYGDRMPETVELFGTTQRLATAEDKSSRERVRFQGTDEFPEVELLAAAAGNQKYILTPTTGKVAAKYDGGEVAAVVNSLGKGRAILLGMTTGEMFRVAGGAKGPGRAWLAAPVMKRLGRQRVEFNCPESEVTLFDHPKGVAVMIGLYSWKPGELPTVPGRLSVDAKREVKEVTSAMHGPLKWALRDGRIEIETPPALRFAVDTVILR
ncbi:MAG: hypothetical protein C0467_21250 [Planctomycetaceae bacterium]|nr:hypothetical protein [Planctomycetaceae bacterium]